MCLPGVHSAGLQSSLRTVEAQLFQAIEGGPESLEVFLKMWSTLQQRIIEAKETISLDTETTTLAQCVATNIMVLSKSFIDINELAASCHSRLLADCQEVLDRDFPSTHSSLDRRKHDSEQRSASLPSHSTRAPKPSLQTPRHPTTAAIASSLAPMFPSRTPSTAASTAESTRSTSDPNPLPEFIEHAYKFFVANIFNPYPTRAEKEAIVTQTNNERVTLSSISNWFTNARRRCGWTTILKERCDGDREQLIALATRVFVNSDSQNPVDPVIAQELMEMKETVETMYERRMRTSSWIEDLGNLEDLIHPLSASTLKLTPTEDRRRAQVAKKKDPEFERRKRKMQEEALRKAEKVAKVMRRKQEKQKIKDGRVASSVDSHPPQQPLDEDAITTPNLPSGSNQNPVTGDDVHRFSDLLQVSPLSPRSASFNSDSSSEGRVPSLTYSDSGDERPYTVRESLLVTPAGSPYTISPRLSPSLEIPVDFNFTSDPPEVVTSDPSAFDTLFNFPVVPCEELTTRGKKRPHDHTEPENSTPNPKRHCGSQPIIASDGPVLPPAPSTSPTNSRPPSTPLFTPRQSFDATPTEQFGESLLQLPDLEAVLGLDLTQPPPAQIALPDPSLPLDVGVFDWASNMFGDVDTGDAQSDILQLLQFVDDDAYQVANLPNGDLPHIDLTSTAFPPHQPTGNHPTFSNDMSGLMSGLMSNEVLNGMSTDFVESLTSTPNLSRGESAAPALPNVLSSLPTPTELAERARIREIKRKEIEEKRAAIERERARLAELERELEDD